MRALVIYILAVVLAVLVTPWFAAKLGFSGMAEVGVLLVLVLSADPSAGSNPSG